MKTITLKKVEIEHFGILQGIAFKSKNHARTILGNTNIYNDIYFNNLLILDVTTNLILRFRNKIENQTKKFGAVNLKIHEAIILLQCCNDFVDSQMTFEKNVVRKYLEEIHKQLINL